LTADSSTVTPTIAIPVPPHVAGDVLLAYIVAGDTSATTASTVTPPTAWHLVLRTDHGTLGLFAVYSKVAAASEPTSYLWSATGTNGGVLFASWMLAYGGVDTTQPVDVAVGQDFTPGTPALSFATPPIVTTGAQELVLASFAGHSATTPPGPWTPPPGVTQVVDTDNAGNRSGASDAIPQAAAGTVGAITAAVTPAQDFAITNAIALRPCH
jgi:hypothetical protein